MLILGRDRLGDPALGYARTFLRQLEGVLGLALDRGVRLVTNAGGLNPAGLADAIRALADRLGLDVAVAHVEGDAVDVPDALTANAYLGAFGIAECLRAGADVVVTGRVTDASLVVGPAIARFGWTRDGPRRACRRNRGRAHPRVRRPGDRGQLRLLHRAARSWPAARVPAGRTARRRVGRHHQARRDGRRGHGRDRHRPTAVRDRCTRVPRSRCRRAVPDHRAARRRARPGTGRRRARLPSAADGQGRREHPRRLPQRDDVRPVWTRHRGQGGPGPRAAGGVRRCRGSDLAAGPHRPPGRRHGGGGQRLATVHIQDADQSRAGRRFSQAAVELALASYPGCTLTTPPGDASPYGVFRAEYLPQAEVAHLAVLPDGTRVRPSRRSRAAGSTDGADPPLKPPTGADEEGAAGDGAPARAQATRAATPTSASGPARMPGTRGWPLPDGRELKRLLPECATLTVRRHDLPNLRAVNFVIEGLLGLGVAASTRFDPQAKALGEWLRSRVVDVPEELL